jgi:hypothetical protein
MWRVRSAMGPSSVNTEGSLYEKDVSEERGVCVGMCVCVKGRYLWKQSSERRNETREG